MMSDLPTPALFVTFSNDGTTPIWTSTSPDGGLPAVMLEAIGRCVPVPKSVAYVPRALLDAAGQENDRLRRTIQRVVENMSHAGSEAPESLPCNESCVECDDNMIGGEGHRPDLPADRCSEHPDAESDSECRRCLLTAALTPNTATKESE
jgi:hypothetical protein